MYKNTEFTHIYLLQLTNLWKKTHNMCHWCNTFLLKNTRSIYILKYITQVQPLEYLQYFRDH